MAQWNVPCLIKNCSGFGFVELMVFSALGVTATFFAISALDVANRGAKNVVLSTDLALLRATIAEQTDCFDTLAGVDLNDSALCNSDSSQLNASRFFTLKRKLGNGQSQPLTGSINNTFNAGALGDWSVRTTCSRTEHSLIVRVARITNNAFAKNPVSRQEQNFEASHALLFGGRSGAIPLCSATNTVLVATPTPTPQIPAGMPKRFANLNIEFDRVASNLNGCFTIDLTQSIPRRTTAIGSDLVNANLINSTNPSFNSVSEPFQTTGAIRGIIAYSRLITRQRYVDTVTVPSLSLWDGPPGMIRVCLGNTGDLKADCNSETNGCKINASILVYQM